MHPNGYEWGSEMMGSISENISLSQIGAGARSWQITFTLNDLF
jgi:hypothetical protein